ncbi:MAG: 30S ribosomal protein S20 [Candidatus Blackburnbacteria bacterium]|nr:30S ribosomal protein S20 [Candidatus Blackburnbacteria bacterium]
MPVTKSAKKILKQAKKRGILNARVQKGYKGAVKNFRTKPTSEAFKKAVAALDRAVTKKVIHKNKAARIKSRLAKILPRKSTTPRKRSGKVKK